MPSRPRKRWPVDLRELRRRERAGRKFCTECGAALAVACATCGAAHDGSEKFCGECGTALGALDRPPRLAPAAERRLVSVLFADLVGFTRCLRDRDAEETRELLSRYFDTCRRLIELYGGTVEKFIGDAVMAVWGTPTATEDDAERAVRAALDLVAAVSALGDEVGAGACRRGPACSPEKPRSRSAPRARGWSPATSSTPPRGSSPPPSPGTVFVGEATRRTTEQTIAYADAGSFELKGKDGLTPLWQALRVVSGARGSLKSARPRGAVRRP